MTLASESTGSKPLEPMTPVPPVTPQILCLGEILEDYLADQMGFPLAQVESWTAYPGGAPANVACSLIKLGVPAAFIGCLGEDCSGRFLTNLLATLGVNLEGLQFQPHLPTRRVYVTRSLEGDRHFAGFGEMATTAFADTALQASEIPESLFTTAQYLVLGTIPLAYPSSRQAVKQAIALAEYHQVAIFLDINWRPVFWPDPQTVWPLLAEIMPWINWLKCTDEEAQLFFHTTDPQTIRATYPHLQGVLITAGERGCHYQLGNYQGYVPAFEVSVADTTGAGDAFVAGFLHQCCQWGNHVYMDPQLAQRAVIYASAVGALTTTQPGAIAAQPTLETVQKFMRTHWESTVC